MLGTCWSLSQQGLIHQSCVSDTHITPRYIQMELSGNSNVLTSWCLLSLASSSERVTELLLNICPVCCEVFDYLFSQLQAAEQTLFCNKKMRNSRSNIKGNKWETEAITNVDILSMRSVTQAETAVNTKGYSRDITPL